MADKTKKPTGLKLTRKNDTFTASWKIADKDYGDGQAMQVRKGSGKWSAVSIGKKDKAKGFTVSRGDYYPNTKTVKGKTTNKPKLGSVSFRVRGNRKEYTTRKKVNGKTKDVQINPDVSDWSTKTFTVRKPNNPSISVSTGTWPTSTFSWSVKDSASDERVYTRMKIDSVLLCDSNISKGKDVDWTKNINGMTIRVNGAAQTRTKYNGTSASASGTLTIQEDSGALQNGHSYTRWVRVIAQGPAGDSAPKYQKHVYADPNKAKIDSVALTPKTNGFRAQVKFSSPFGNSRPIKNVDVQWAMDTPAADLACPSGATWTTGKTVIVSDASGGAAFDIDQTIPENECLWFRVNTNWDDATTYGDPFYKAAGALTAPTITDITPNATNHTVTVTATNNASAIPDSFMVVRYYDEEEPDGFDIAIIPHGSTTATGVQCPAWETTPKFGVYAAVGDYSIIERDDGVDQYDVDAQMTSQIQTQGGSVPEAPENVSLSATAIPGTIRVQWDWPWDEADSAELSWADHEDAWESTEGPETYTITKLHAAAWNISGLETGQTWYVRVRLIANNGDAVTYGAYSDTKTIDLSSAPLAPVITLTDHVIAEDGEVTASWSYSTTDGTAQAFAEVALVTYENGEPVYEPIAQTQTAQYITMNQETFDWQTGETYLFAVRVISASGRSSDAWSDPESLTIAEPPTCEITDTSLVEEEIEINPTTYTGDLLSFETESEETATALTIPLTPIQSLNGYDSPWVGGAGKNKLNLDTEVTVLTGSVPSNATITSAEGTATVTENWYNRDANKFGWAFNVESNQTYTISGNCQSTANATIKVYSSDGSLVHSYNASAGYNFTTSFNAGANTTLYFYVSITSWGQTITVQNVQIEKGSTATSYAPYSNICPISGWDEVNAYVSPTTDAEDGTTYPVNLSDTAGTVYGGTLDVVSGALTVTDANIASYNGETLPSTWISDRDVYASGTTPTTGAQVVYKLATPQTYQLTPTQIMTLVGDNNVWSDAGEITLTIAEAAETVMALKDMPLTITVTGAQETQETQVAIERAAAYHVDRPDETDFNGFEGETVALATQVGDETFSFEVEDLIGRLDDGALYRIIATVQDGFGQAATDTVDFTVIWTEQATEPTAEVEMHGTAAYLTPIANEEGNPDDVCDIYRLSVDRPQLIYEGATFGETYVDPYPTIGEFGGHRFVTRTANGDYIMDDPETGDSLAWYDTGENEDDNLAVRYNIIDFDRGQAFLTYNADISGSWRKDFKETQYLGGSVQGDWNKAVSRTAQVNVTAVADNEQDLIQTMRRLADHTGLCHVRTKDGSSYPADVEVSESYNYASGVKTYEYQLTITRVDPEELDGMTLAEWNEVHDTGEDTR